MTSETKIFGIGLPRTGTTSLALALQSYGIETIHYPFDLYDQGLEAPVAEQFTAFVDTPVPMLYKELDRQWPDSKFILTLRNKDDWLKSMAWLRTEGRKIWQPDPARDQYQRDFYGTPVFDRDMLSKKFDAYHKEVDQYFEGRDKILLRLNIIDSSSTAKLVDFLCIEDAVQPWPRANRSREANLMQELAHQFEKRGYRAPGAFIRRTYSAIRRRLPYDS